MSVTILSGPPEDAATSVRTVVCYLRTANAGTAAQRLLARQRTRLEREAAAHGWTVLEWVEDLRQSGATLARPGLTRALNLLAHHQADALVACEPTRLARSAAVTRQLAAHAAAYGWQLVIVQDDRQLPLFPTRATPDT